MKILGLQHQSTVTTKNEHYRFVLFQYLLLGSVLEQWFHETSGDWLQSMQCVRKYLYATCLSCIDIDFLFLRILGFGCNIALLETDQCCFLWSSYNIDKLAFNSDFLLTPYCKMDATVWTKAIWLTHCNGLWHSQWHFHWPFKLMPGF